MNVTAGVHVRKILQGVDQRADGPNDPGLSVDSS